MGSRPVGSRPVGSRLVVEGRRQRVWGIRPGLCIQHREVGTGWLVVRIGSAVGIGSALGIGSAVAGTGSVAGNLDTG